MKYVARKKLVSLLDTFRRYPTRADAVRCIFIYWDGSSSEESELVASAIAPILELAVNLRVFTYDGFKSVYMDDPTRTESLILNALPRQLRSIECHFEALELRDILKVFGNMPNLGSLSFLCYEDALELLPEGDTQATSGCTDISFPSLITLSLFTRYTRVEELLRSWHVPNLTSLTVNAEEDHDDNTLTSLFRCIGHQLLFLSLLAQSGTYHSPLSISTILSSCPLLQTFEFDTEYPHQEGWITNPHPSLQHLNLRASSFFVIQFERSNERKPTPTSQHNLGLISRENLPRLVSIRFCQRHNIWCFANGGGLQAMDRSASSSFLALMISCRNNGVRLEDEKGMEFITPDMIDAWKKSNLSMLDNDSVSV